MEMPSTSTSFKAPPRASRQCFASFWFKPMSLLQGTCHQGPAHSPPYLGELLLLQVPFLYPVVSGAAEEDVSLDGQTFNAIVVGGLKVMSGADVTRHAFRNLKHLQGTDSCESLAQSWGKSSACLILSATREVKSWETGTKSPTDGWPVRDLWICGERAIGEKRMGGSGLVTQGLLWSLVCSAVTESPDIP